MYRWWRGVGEAPCLWAKLKLNFRHLTFPHTHILQVLSLKRLQCLEYLSLRCKDDGSIAALEIIVSESLIILTFRTHQKSASPKGINFQDFIRNDFSNDFWPSGAIFRV